ncbi:MAG TPA: DUF4349 domain-containing protein [Nannocystaceae bacterium]|nr:DUF4349 domain-containing protein [Nannocystaceae bacterium]
MVGLVLFGFGCKTNFSPSTYDYAGVAAPPPADGAGTDLEMEMADSDPAPAEEDALRRDSARFERKAKPRGAKDVMASAPASGTTAAEPIVSKGEPAVEEPRQDLDTRHVIYVATLTVSVFNLQDAIAKAELLPEALGGYIHSMEGGTLVLRVPAKLLRKALEQIAELGVVEHRALSAQDVGAEYVDIESRIRALETTQKQLLELMSKARTVDEALHVRQALDGVTAELEVLKGRMRQLDNLIAYSTITVTLMERGPHTPVPSSNDPFPWVDELGVEATEWK